MPATKKWFRPHQGQDIGDSHQIGLTDYLEEYLLTVFPYELLYPQNHPDSSTEQEAVTQFCLALVLSGDPMNTALADIIQSNLPHHSKDTHIVQFTAPLVLLKSALSFNMEKPGGIKWLYIAQAPLTDLPTQLREDVPIPKIVQAAGNGDIYDSSIWLGLEPTYTPWHRDPNPNVFCQLCSSKVMRLLPPSAGEGIYRKVQMELGHQGNSRIRGAEMMEGSERSILHDAVWGRCAPKDVVEAQVDPGDALFIPKGWWHSVKSLCSDGRLNGSVNWWFR